MNRIGEVLAELKERRKRKKAAAGSDIRINDLFEKLYHYDKEIAIPIPNLYAYSIIEAEFGGLEKVDFDDNAHIAKLLFILRNQDIDEIEYLTGDEKAAKIREIQRGIPLQQKERYKQALYELFIALKKNSNRWEREILTQTLDILGSN